MFSLIYEHLGRESSFLEFSEERQFNCRETGAMRSTTQAEVFLNISTHAKERSSTFKERIDKSAIKRSSGRVASEKTGPGPRRTTKSNS